MCRSVTAATPLTVVVAALGTPALRDRLRSPRSATWGKGMQPRAPFRVVLTIACLAIVCRVDPAAVQAAGPSGRFYATTK